MVIVDDQEARDQEAHLVRKERQEMLDLRELLEEQEPVVNQEHKVLVDLQEALVLLVNKDKLVHVVYVDQEDKQEVQEDQVLKDKLVSKVHKDLWV